MESLAEARVSFVKTNLKEADGKRLVVTNRHEMVGNKSGECSTEYKIPKSNRSSCMYISYDRR
jgi:hypothetical protein